MFIAELMNCPLKSGARPPLLFDVLRSAAAIGEHAKMIVEIKAGNTEAGPALARMFLRHPNLMDHVAVVMSFDAFIMHNFRREMEYVHEQLYTPPVPTLEEQKSDMLSTSPNLRPSSSYLGLNRGPSPHTRLPDLSSSPNLRPSYLWHNRGPSPRLPSMLGGEILVDSQDGHVPTQTKSNLSLSLDRDHTSSPNLRPSSYLGHNSHTRLPLPPTTLPPTTTLPLPSCGDQNVAQPGLGLSISPMINLVDVKKTAPSSSTFLPIQKSSDNLEELDPSVMSVRSFPKLLLITVADEPKKDYVMCPDELHVDITNPDKITELEGWLRGRDGGSLDGVYMQYQKVMLGIEGQNIMRNLASRYNVGIWGANPVPDDWHTFHSLVTECHVSYVNSSLPRNFLRKMKRSMSANTLAMNAILVGKDY